MTGYNFNLQFNSLETGIYTKTMIFAHLELMSRGIFYFEIIDKIENSKCYFLDFVLLSKIKLNFKIF